MSERIVTRYIIEATDTGFTLSWEGGVGRGQQFEEVGGHGPIEHLFARTQDTWDQCRQVTTPTRYQHDHYQRKHPA